jgi:opacity protein-like surface antigen
MISFPGIRLSQRFYKTVLFFSLCIFSYTAQASSIKIQPLITLSGGEVVTKVGEPTHFMSDDSIYTYYPAHTTQHNAVYGAMIGGETQINSQCLLQAGVSFYEPTFIKSTGTVEQGVDPGSMENYPYRYSVISRQILLEGKLLANAARRFHPYLSVGIGEAINNVYGYTVDYPHFLTFTPQFNSHINHSISYMFGVGVDVDVSSHVRLGAGYRFNNRGQADLGGGTIDTESISETLKQSHLYGQDVLIQLTYLV